MDGQIISTVDAPEVIILKDDIAEEVLCKFYRDLGWNGQDFLDPRKVRTTKAVFCNFLDVLKKGFPNNIGIPILMLNIGPGTDEYVPPGKVCLLEGWTRPDTSEAVA